jgi:hypothetical protein
MKNLSVKNVFLAVGLVSMIIFSGCASAPEPQPQPPAQEVRPEPEVTETFFTHTVKWPGESLSIISAWYTGDIQNWKALAEANPDVNPNRIHEGMKLLIPESMMKTKAAMTKEHVEGFYPKAKKPVKPSATPAREKDEEPILFGPKQYPTK